MVGLGLCQCGCGEKTPLAKNNNKKRGHVKGEPLRFIYGHENRGRFKGEKGSKWNGGKTINYYGYIQTLYPDHPRANVRGYVFEHILIAEIVLDKYLPDKAVVHHIDGNPNNNKIDNLVICENNSYHLLLHKRQRSLKACGHVNGVWCRWCKSYHRPDKKKERLNCRAQHDPNYARNKKAANP